MYLEVGIKSLVLPYSIVPIDINHSNMYLTEIEVCAKEK